MQHEVLIFVRVDRVRPPHDLKARQRPRRPRQLSTRLFQVIEVQVAIAPRPDEVADRKPALLRQDMREERIGGDVERHPEEQVGRALIELERQPAVRDVRLEQAVAGR